MSFAVCVCFVQSEQCWDMTLFNTSVVAVGLQVSEGKEGRREGRGGEGMEGKEGWGRDGGKG